MATASSIQKFRLAAKDYLNDQQFSDFTIVCEGQEFQVHRCFIAAHSPYFKQCCTGVFEETKNSRVELKEDLKEVVEKMITFFYTFDYDDKIDGDSTATHTSCRPATRVQMNAHVYALADKYQVDDLKALAVEKMKTNVDVTNRFQMLGAAWTVWKVIKLPDTDTTLRDIVLNMWVMAAADLFDGEGAGIIAEISRDMPLFTANLLGMFASGAKNGTVRFTCSKCKRNETVPRSKVLVTEYRCKNCGSTEAASLVTINGPVAIEKFW